MHGMTNIPLNEEVYEQLKSSCEEVKFEEPKIDIDDNLENYIESLEYIEPHEREILLQEHIEHTIKPSFLQWKRQYAGNNTLLQNIRTQINNLKTYNNNLKTSINNLRNKITDGYNEIALKNEQINDAEHNIVSTKKIDLKYEWKKAFIFITFSIVVAFATYIYFLDNQVNLKWSAKTPQDRAIAIEQLITEYHDEGYINYIASTQDNCFTKYRNDDDRLDKQRLLEDLEYVDLSCIEPNLLVNAPTPSISSIFTINKKLLFLAFSAFLLMMLGKIIAVIYEKIGYKNWIFYTFSTLALIVVLLTTYVNSSLSSLDIEKSQIEKAISSLDAKINKIKKDYENGMEYDEDEPDKWKKFTVTVKTKKELHEQESKLPAMEKNISSYSFLVSLLTMLAELAVGSVAWMTYADYIKKKQEIEISSGGYIETLKKEKSELETLIKEYKEEIIGKEAHAEKAQELSGTLSTLIGSIHSNEEIEAIIQSYEDSIIAKGKAMLRVAVTRWRKG